MENNKWLEGKFDSLDKKIDNLTHLVRNHLQHHFIFTMGVLAGLIALAAALIKVVCG